MPQNNDALPRVLHRHKAAQRTGTVSDEDLVIERPRTVAAALGISLATFWRKVKDEPGFPQLVRLGPNSVGIVRAERLAYARRLIAERDAGPRGAA